MKVPASLQNHILHGNNVLDRRIKATRAASCFDLPPSLAARRDERLQRSPSFTHRSLVANWIFKRLIFHHSLTFLTAPTPPFLLSFTLFGKFRKTRRVNAQIAGKLRSLLGCAGRTDEAC